LSADLEHLVTVDPSGLAIAARHGELLMAAAARQGIHWPTACEGKGICTRCVMVVPPEHAERFSPMESLEREALRSVRWREREVPEERLACQARVLGAARVTKKFVRPRRESDR